MKIVINENEQFDEIEVEIKCKRVDDNLLKVIASLRSFDNKITGIKDGKVFVINISDIYYFESVDKKTFMYMNKDVYEVTLKLYEIEERYSGMDFFRASKSTVINIGKIKTILPVFGGKLEVILENNEKLIISRQYVPILKNKLDF